MEEEKLILAVEKFKELYDPGHRNYLDTRRKENVWEEIGRDLQKTGEECKQLWARIRRNYRKALTWRKTKSDQTAGVNKPIRFEKQLDFLRPYIQSRIKSLNSSNHQSDEEDNEAKEGETKPLGKRPASPASPAPVCQPYPPSPLQQYIEYKKTRERKQDQLSKYFQAVEETVRTLPLLLQIETRSKLNNIMYEMESRAYDQHSSNRFQQPPRTRYITAYPSPTQSQASSPSTSPIHHQDEYNSDS